MAVVVPEGFLSNTSPKTYEDVRQYLLENATLKSIISLPRGAFEPYNRAKANILYFTGMKMSRTKGHYWYFDVQNDGYTLDRKRKRIQGGTDLEVVLSEGDLESLSENYLHSIGVVRIDANRVRRNNWALNAAHYREPIGLNPRYPTISFRELFEPSGRDRIGDDKCVPVMSITMYRGLVDQSEKFKKRIASDDISKYRKVYRDELVVGFPIDEGVLGFQLKYPYAAVSPAYTVWRLRRSDIDVWFLDRLLRSPQMREIYKVKLQGAVDRRRTIDPNVFLGIRIPIPPTEVQAEIVEMRQKMHEAQKGIRLLEQDIDNGIGDLWHWEDEGGWDKPD